MSNYWRTNTGRITITRYNESDFEKAITDAEKRGYELVKRLYEPQHHVIKQFYPNRIHKYEYKGTETHGKWIAVMKKREDEGK